MMEVSEELVGEIYVKEDQKPLYKLLEFSNTFEIR